MQNYSIHSNLKVFQFNLFSIFETIKYQFLRFSIVDEYTSRESSNPKNNQSIYIFTTCISMIPSEAEPSLARIP